jgi:hypothetical protein
MSDSVERRARIELRLGAESNPEFRAIVNMNLADA